MDKKYLVWGGLGVGLVILLYLARGGSQGGSQVQTLGPAPDDGPTMDPSGLFGALASVTESLELGRLQASVERELAQIQAGLEAKRIAAAEDAARIQADAYVKSAQASASASKADAFWGAVGDVGTEIVRSVGGGYRGGYPGSYGGPRYTNTMFSGPPGYGGF